MTAHSRTAIRPRSKDQIASIAATGFGLTAYCIAADHRWIGHEAARERVLTALRFLAYLAPQEHGWFYHFMNAGTGARAWRSEVSSIDTALLLAGVLTSRQYFSDDVEIASLATLIYDRIDFPWMMGGDRLHFSHGWTPETGFLPYRWDTYSELLILYTLGIGSPAHAISAASWDSWKLPMVGVGDYRYVGGGPLFVQQYSQAWIDVRDRFPSVSPESGIVQLGAPPVSHRLNYYARFRLRRPGLNRNSSAKTSRASSPAIPRTCGASPHRTAPSGYTDWGASPADPRIDGTVVPSAAAGSLMFTPDICIPAMRAMLVKYGQTIYGRYGFADAFNPTTGWASRYVIGIDAGITLLSAENLRTGSVWRWFMMRSRKPEHALDLVGLGRLSKPPTPRSTGLPSILPAATLLLQK